MTNFVIHVCKFMLLFFFSIVFPFSVKIIPCFARLIVHQPAVQNGALYWLACSFVINFLFRFVLSPIEARKSSFYWVYIKKKCSCAFHFNLKHPLSQLFLLYFRNFPPRPLHAPLHLLASVWSSHLCVLTMRYTSDTFVWNCVCKSNWLRKFPLSKIA